MIRNNYAHNSGVTRMYKLLQTVGTDCITREMYYVSSTVWIKGIKKEMINIIVKFYRDIHFKKTPQRERLFDKNNWHARSIESKPEYRFVQYFQLDDSNSTDNKCYVYRMHFRYIPRKERNRNQRHIVLRAHGWS